MVIAHATDLLPDGGIAFDHAIGLAQRFGARLVSLNARSAEPEGRRMPTVEDQVVKWLDQRPVDHSTVIHEGYDDPVDTLLAALNELSPELLVVGHRRANAFQRLLRGSVSMALALNAKVPTLILAIGGRAFVRHIDGAFSLRTVVIPVGSEEAGEAALGMLARLVEGQPTAPVEVHLVACGETTALETLAIPELPHVHFHPHQIADTVAHAVTTVADTQDADLIIMASRGQDSVHDVFIGTNTEQVVRHTDRPLLCVPIRRGR